METDVPPETSWTLFDWFGFMTPSSDSNSRAENSKGTGIKSFRINEMPGASWVDIGMAVIAGQVPTCSSMIEMDMGQEQAIQVVGRESCGFKACHQLFQTGSRSGFHKTSCLALSDQKRTCRFLLSHVTEVYGKDVDFTFRH